MSLQISKKVFKNCSVKSVLENWHDAPSYAGLSLISDDWKTLKAVLKSMD